MVYASPAPPAGPQDTQEILSAACIPTPPWAPEAVSVNSGTAVADVHTRFLRTLKEEDRAFRFPVTIDTPKGPMTLETQYTQADQGSDLVIATRSLNQKAGLKMQSLAKIGFAGMSMRTADQRPVPLEYCATLCLRVNDIWRTVTCFILPESENTSLPAPGWKLLLGLPWLPPSMRASTSGEAQ